MAFWKQLLLIVVIAVAGVAGWGAVDPTARPRLLALGVPDVLLPDQMFLAKADGPAEGTGGPGAGPGQPQAASGQRPAGEGRPGQGAPGAGGQAAGQGAPGGGGQAAGQGGRPPGAGGPGGGRGFGGPVLVVTDAARIGTVNDRVSAIGTAEAARTVILYPRTTGMVASVGFAPGQNVARGDVLVRLDDDAESIAFEQAQLTLADARAKVERYEKLVDSAAISNVVRDEARSELAAAELTVREARLALDRRSVLAPFAGTVGLTSVEVGDMVTATTEIATLDDRTTLRVEFRIPESAAAKVSLGQQVVATTPSRPGDVFEGVVSAVDSRVEIDSRTLVVQAEIDNAGDLLRPGMSFLVELRFPGDTHLQIPSLSLQWDREGSFVWRIVEGKAERVPVAIIQRNTETVLVTGDLGEGDVVVVEGVQRLRPGAAVALAGETAPTDPAAPPPPRG